MFNDIRIAPNELYSMSLSVQTHTPEQENSAFSELMNEAPKENEPENKINFSSLGAPAGFVADISMLDEADAKEIGLIGL